MEEAVEKPSSVNCSTLPFGVTHASRGGAPGNGVRAATRYGKEHCGAGKTTQQCWNRPSVPPVFMGEEFFHLRDTGNRANFPEDTLLLVARNYTGKPHDAFFHRSGN